MRHGNLAVLMAALLLIRYLIFDLERAGARFDHLLGKQIGCLGIAEACIDIGDNRHDMCLMAIDCLLRRSGGGFVTGLTSGIKLAEQAAQFARIGLAQESVKLFDQCRNAGLFVHGLIRKWAKFAPQRGDHPARQIEVAPLGGTEMLLDADHLLLADKPVPAAE